MKNTGLKRGAYSATTAEGVVVFVSGTTSTLEQVEWNHRNNNPLDSENATKFRTALNERNLQCSFKWEVLPYICTPEQIQSQVNALIQKHKPALND